MKGIASAAAQGCSYWYIDLNLASDQLSRWTDRRVTEVRDAAMESGLTPIVHGSVQVPLGTEIPEIQGALQEYLRSELILASRLGSPSLIVHGGCRLDSNSSEEVRRGTVDRVIENLESSVDFAKQMGVQIWIENLPEISVRWAVTLTISRLDELKRLTASYPDIGVILDVGHSHVNQWFAPAAIRDMGDRIRAVSLSANDGTFDQHTGLAGNIPMIEEVLESIRESSWQGLVFLETPGVPVANSLATLFQIWSRRAPADTRDPVAKS